MVLRNVVNGKVPLAQSALAHIRWVSRHAALTVDDCRPLVFPSGSEGDVVSKAAEFLTKVETVQQP
jgi:hypothetical protein